MNFFEVIKKRRSIRKYKEKPVEDEKLKLILEAGRLAPSARNRQAWRFIVIKDEKIKEKLYKVSKNQKFLTEAPVVIALVGYPTDYVSSNGNVGHLVDLGIAGEHMVLAATSLGLGTCWVVAFNQEKVKEILGVPREGHVVALITVGYPDETPHERYVKDIKEIARLNHWEGPPPF